MPKKIKPCLVDREALHISYPFQPKADLGKINSFLYWTGPFPVIPVLLQRQNTVGFCKYLN